MMKLLILSTAIAAISTFVPISTNRANGVGILRSSVEDQDPATHSYIVKAAISELESNHAAYHEKLWASTTGTVVGEIQHSPRGAWPQEGLLCDEFDSDWLPEAMGEIIEGTEVWCDYSTMTPPTGLFLEKIKSSLVKLSKKSEQSKSKIVVRFLFGDIIAKPIDCDALMEEFTNGIDPDKSNLEIWVGASRKGVTWNHAKIVASDGKQLYTGGHNPWDKAYLRKYPIHDVSIHLAGDVTIQAHQFLNDPWEFIKKEETSMKQLIIDKLVSEETPLPVWTRVASCQWPQKGVSKFPPMFDKDILPKNQERDEEVKMLSLGRYGSIGYEKCDKKERSSDSAFVAMYDAARDSIKISQEDIGPVLVIAKFGERIEYGSWPKEYMKAWGRAMYERDVDVEIVLSNCGSVAEDGESYSNNWSCEEVAAEIIKTVVEQYPDATEEEIKKKMTDHLRVCFIKNKCGSVWPNSKRTVGLHSKVFIVDDSCIYVGSQNLYYFDLCEFGVVIGECMSISPSFFLSIYRYRYVSVSLVFVDVVVVAHSLVVSLLSFLFLYLLYRR